ncbi:MAG: hypothetical protein WC697_03170 [Patescibacteria group bacterium]|jgi:hypothetical protein
MRLIIISGANGALGIAYLNYFKNKTDIKCAAIVRSEFRANIPNISVINADLLNAKKIKAEIENIDLSEISDVIFIHPVGKFKFEKTGKPEIDENNDGIDDEIYESNVETFLNVVNPLIVKLGKEAKNNNFISLAICAFGSISDRYNIRFWHSYTKAKNKLKNFIWYITQKDSYRGLIRGVFVNVSTTDTGNENKLRPFADKKYWLSCKEIVEQSAPLLLETSVQWKEIDIYKPVPDFNSNYYTNIGKILKKWNKEMGKK